MLMMDHECPEATVGTQLFLSSPIQSNESLAESTASSSNPLVASSNVEKIALGMAIVVSNCSITEAHSIFNYKHTAEEEDDRLSDSEDDQSLHSETSQNTNDEWQCEENHQFQQAINTIMTNKSSKAMYKAVAKEWGITCEMSEQCRCMDCQSNYFNCEYDQVRSHLLVCPA